MVVMVAPPTETWLLTLASRPGEPAPVVFKAAWFVTLTFEANLVVPSEVANPPVTSVASNAAEPAPMVEIVPPLTLTWAASANTPTAP